MSPSQLRILLRDAIVGEVVASAKGQPPSRTKHRLSSLCWWLIHSDREAWSCHASFRILLIFVSYGFASLPESSARFRIVRCDFNCLLKAATCCASVGWRFGQLLGICHLTIGSIGASCCGSARPSSCRVLFSTMLLSGIALKRRRQVGQVASLSARAQR